jgi:hypothetical protein
MIILIYKKYCIIGDRMNINIIANAFEERKPISKDDIQEVLKIDNKNTLNQTISYLVSFGVIKRFENGIYYVPSAIGKFSQLKPSLKDVVQKKYLLENQGIRTGMYLLYKYKFTSQVSSFYEILSNNVSKHTRSKQLYEGKVIVSYPPFVIHKNNINILEILELLKYIHYGDYSLENSQIKLQLLIKRFNLDKEEIINYSTYYKGKRYAGFRETVIKVVYNEVASQSGII